MSMLCVSEEGPGENFSRVRVGKSSLTNHFQTPQSITSEYQVSGCKYSSLPWWPIQGNGPQGGFQDFLPRVLQGKDPVPLKGRNVKPEGFLAFCELWPRKKKGERTRKFTLQFFHQYFLFSLAALLSNCDAPTCKASARSSSSDSISSLFKTLSTFTRMMSTT